MEPHAPLSRRWGLQPGSGSAAALDVMDACSSTSDPQKRYPRDAGGDRVQFVADAVAPIAATWRELDGRTGLS